MQLFAVNSLDLYSSGVTLQALGLRVKRYQAVLVDTVICCGITIYAVFDSSFATLLTDFVDVVICWIAPWCAIFLVDWVLRRYRYLPAELQKTDRTSVYWRTRWDPLAGDNRPGARLGRRRDGARHHCSTWARSASATGRCGFQHLHGTGCRWDRAICCWPGGPCAARRRRTRLLDELDGCLKLAGVATCLGSADWAAPTSPAFPSQSSTRLPSGPYLKSGIAPSERTRSASAPRVPRHALASVSSTPTATGVCPDSPQELECRPDRSSRGDDVVDEGDAPPARRP